VGWHGDQNHSGFDPDIASAEAAFAGGRSKNDDTIELNEKEIKQAIREKMERDRGISPTDDEIQLCIRMEGDLLSTAQVIRTTPKRTT
jgi:hypothetical protein